MSSSTNSEKHLLSQRRIVKNYERYGYRFIVHVMEYVRREWQQVIKDKDGNLITGPLDPDNHVMDWAPTAKTITTSYVQAARFVDEEDCADGKFVFVYSTPDGPIMGIEYSRNDEYFQVMDPCVIQYSAAGTIRLLPIFNVGRDMLLYRSAVRVQTAPAEVLLTAYPAFVLQHRASAYQLKSPIALVETTEVDNEADDAIEIKA